MGYGYYIYDGKECGYLVEAVCEAEGCQIEIDRGLAYACGGEPGEDADFCNGYFCLQHLYFTLEDIAGSGLRCGNCIASFRARESELDESIN